MDNVIFLPKPPPQERVLRFGDRDQWAISLDDGCLRFHPDYEEHPKQVSAWIWPEAWAFVSAQGGFEVVADQLRAATD